MSWSSSGSEHHLHDTDSIVCCTEDDDHLRDEV